MSVLNLDLNCIFIHIPRTAGTSMEQFVGGQGHRNITYFKRFIIGQAEGLTFDDTFKFAFVRNPYDRFVSCYQWASDHYNDWKLSIRNVNELAISLDKMYEAWPEDSLSKLMFKPQWKHVCNQYKDIQVDFVGRFENLKDDWRTVANKLHIDAKLPHTNKSNRSASWEKELNSQTKRTIVNLYRDDFEVFGYNK